MVRVAAGSAGSAGSRKAVGVLAALLLAAVAACSGGPAEEGPRESSPGAGAERDAGGPQKGPYKVRTQTVSPGDTGGDFGSGTVYYPDDDSRRYGVIAASPGLGADESMVTPYGELLASHGFVVITFNTKTTEDSPPQRGRQLLDALDHATRRSAAADRADPERLGVLGHSMGGGGALYAAERNPKVKAAVPLTPYAERGEWRRVKAPTLVIGGSDDEVAPTSEHAEVFYEGLSGAREKAYLELDGDHFAATPPDGLVARQVVAWFRYFVAGDTDSAGRLCPPPRTAGVTDSRDTCPLG
ncbi:alpha/beta fold hydrolase [Streptomyces sp. WMMB 322]|uniref:alpha/beta hydrolase family protein n=1 Tax=Streptomyces sp. WMMB 322 TaxID=1286821 RepID=UPI0006E20684|nr:alpha/beta fold hydrolase [Streptomyces sp. WMMB 322]SCK47051.1 Alpha/beta hydrolase family protein [Streptomyces sp. WMMB 322]